MQQHASLTAGLTLSATGTVEAFDETAPLVLGIPPSALLGREFATLFDAQRHRRCAVELAAIREGRQRMGRFTAPVRGVDGVLRGVVVTLRAADDGTTSAEVSADHGVADRMPAAHASLAESHRLLPVGRRLAAVCRRATSRAQLLSDAITILAEVTNAACAASIEWGGSVAEWPVVATAGNFDSDYLHGLFRSSLVGRLAKGEVIVKDAFEESSPCGHTLILIPLMAGISPEGVAILYLERTSHFIPEEVQSLGLLGELIGLGLRCLTAGEGSDETRSTAADVEATVALGRLSAGLAHEINNAVTVLQNNSQRLLEDIHRFGLPVTFADLTQDNLKAIAAIRSLIEALRAFAPEATRSMSDVDLAGIVGMVTSTFHFFAQRGVRITTPAVDTPVWVRGRAHFLVRALFLIFVEVLETAKASGRDLFINIDLKPKKTEVLFVLKLQTMGYQVSTVLIGQLEKDGALVRLLSQAGAQVTYEMADDLLHVTMRFEQARLPDEQRTAPARNSRRGTILIVDDAPAVIRSTRRILERAHDVLAASSAEEALKIIQSNPNIDLLLLDVFMPTMSGIELAKLLRRQHNPLADRIIFITGGADDRDLSAFARETNLPVVEKPLDIDLLTSLISDMIALYDTPSEP